MCVLDQLGASTQFAWDDLSQDGFLISRFRRGPSTVVMAGFPLGLTVRGVNIQPPQWESLIGTIKPQLALVPFSPFHPHSERLGGPFYERPESAITDLRSWDSSATPGRRTRQNIRRALRMTFVNRDGSPEDAPFAYDVYQNTVRRHRGKARYTQGYFRSLLDFTRENNLTRTVITQHGDAPLSYATVVVHGTVASYLHGGFSRSLRHERPVDLALLEAIEWSRDVGASVFNMLPSPPSQRGLIAYKEKWGGVTTKPHRTYVASRVPGAAKLFASFRAKRGSASTYAGARS